MRLRYAGTCRACGVDLPARTDAIYQKSTKTVRCVECVPAPSEPEKPQLSRREGDPTEVEPGVPGGSARREFERRRASREQRIRVKHPRLGGLILALGDEPQSTTAWDTGAIGEERLGARLNEYASDSIRVLHDRRIPGSRANIDHIVVARSGVYVVDAKRYKGRPTLKVEGGVLRPRVEKLLVGRRDCTRVVDSVRKQVEVVRGIVEDDRVVHGVLCFVEADWPLIGGSFVTRDVDVLWPKKLYAKLSADGPWSTGQVRALHRLLGGALPPAH
ncbi:NERD domain-containing protein [Nocardioides sp.]|nr:NERD domain-containing protein [Nocardioides sp.]